MGRGLRILLSAQLRATTTTTRGSAALRRPRLGGVSVARSRGTEESPRSLGRRWSGLGGSSEESERGTNKTLPDMLIACVGDVHGLWNRESEEALSWLQPDLSLFVGDFGEEDVELVAEVARVPERKAVILGNHDAWYSASPTRRGNSVALDGVEEQLDILGDDHVGLSAKTLPDLGLSVVGCRPFSKGGGDWKRFSKFYRQLYGLRNFDDSATQIVGNSFAEPEHHRLIFLGHNGPTGLGSSADSPCGLDFRPEEGDFGDRDMEDAIRAVLKKGRRVPLAVFGHMHERLHRFALPRTSRRMFHLDKSSGVAYVNCAVVPRIREAEGDPKATQHNFVLVTMTAALEVERVESVWLQKNQGGGSFERVETTEWYNRESG